MRDGDTSVIETAPEPFSAHFPGEQGSSLNPADERELPQASIRTTAMLFLLGFMSAIAAYLALILDVSSPSELLTHVQQDWSILRPALVYALGLTGIYLAHDLGHLWTSSDRRVRQSYPYYVPFPFLIGNLGSLIFMRDSHVSRRALIRIGFMGPLSRLLVAIPIAAYGLSVSTPVEPGQISAVTHWLGHSLLFAGLAHVFSPQGIDIQLHPLGYAGWAGLLSASFHLLPISELDGALIARAFFGRWARLLSGLSLIGLLAYSIYLTLNTSFGHWAAIPWLFWGLLLLMLNRKPTQIARPDEKLERRDYVFGVVALMMLVATTVPVPVQFFSPDAKDPSFRVPQSQDRLDLGNDREVPEPESFEL